MIIINSNCFRQHSHKTLIKLKPCELRKYTKLELKFNQKHIKIKNKKKGRIKTNIDTKTNFRFGGDGWYRRSQIADLTIRHQFFSASARYSRDV